MGSKPTKRNNLVALGSAAVLAVYAAGYVRTRSAAELYANESNERRPVRPTPQLTVGQPMTPSVVAAPPTEVATRSQPAAAPKPEAAKPKTAKATDTAYAITTPASRPDSIAVSALPPTAAVAAPAVQTPALPTPAPLPVPSLDSLRAVAVADSAARADSLKSRYKDGFYRGYGTSRHGDIEAELEIRSGKIVYARISQCLTRYSCSWIAHLPDQVIARQSADVDYVSGATQSTDAFYIAVTQALSKAK